MEKLLKKKCFEAKKNRYSFPTTDKVKERLDQLKNQGYDVNEMLRRYAEKLINTSTDDKSA